MKKLIIFLFVLFFSVNAFPADHYILDGGSGDGSAWNNAWDALPAELVRGDTYYIADGEYPSYSFNDAADGTTLITVKKATIADHGTETGWDNAYGDGQAIFEKYWFFYTSYWLITGNGTHTTPSSTALDHGFKIKKESNCEQAVWQKISFESNDLNNITIAYTEFENCGSAYKYDCQELIYSLGTCTNIVIQYNYLHDFGAAILTRGWQNSTIEHNYFKDNWSQQGICNGESVSSDYEVDNIYRGNVFDNACNGSGCIVPGHGPGGGHVSTGTKIYNNIAFNFAGGGLLACGTAHVCNDFEVYNNTVAGATSQGGIADGLGTGGLAYNNLFFDCASVAYNIDTHDYSGFYSCSGTLPTEDHDVVVASPGDPFTDSVGGDYTLDVVGGALVIDAGKSDSPVTDTVLDDIIGTARPENSVYDIGAYETIVGGAVTGTIVADDMSENKMVSGAPRPTIDFTIYNDTLAAAGAPFNDYRQAVIDQCVSAVSDITEPNGWNAEILVDEVVTAITRESDTLMRWTLTANLAFAVGDSDGPITCTIPHEILVTATEDVVAAPSFTIYNEDPSEIYPTTGVGYSATGPAAGYSATGQAVGLPAEAP